MKRRAFIAGSGALAASVISGKDNSLMAAEKPDESKNGFTEMPSSIKPPKLKKGDMVDVVSPAWGGAGLFPHREELGIRQLENFGYKLEIAK